MRSTGARRSSTRSAWTAASAAAVVALSLFGVFACSRGTPFGESEAGDAGADGENEATGAEDGATDDLDGATDASPDGGEEAGGRDAQLAVACGMTACTEPGGGCCSDPAAAPPGGYSCVLPPDFCPAGSVRLTCDDDDDCTALGQPGTVCCGSLDSSNNAYFVAGTSCVIAENCVGAKELRLCNRSVAGECPPGKPCDLVTSLPAPADGGGGTWPVRSSVSACQR